MCQPVSKIFIGCGLTVCEDRLLMVIAEKNVKGNVCCLINNKQFNEVILSQMDLFFYYKKYMKKPKSLISKIWNVFLKLTFKSRKKKKNVERNSFIFIYCFLFVIFYHFRWKPFSPGTNLNEHVLFQYRLTTFLF